MHHCTVQSAVNILLVYTSFVQLPISLSQNVTEGKLFDYRKLFDRFRSLIGSRIDDPFRILMPVKRGSASDRNSIPVEFDARLKWPFCPTIGQISVQGKCASCWAVAATDVMSDRICIHSQGLNIVRISAGNLLSCCRTCGKGCKGGFPSAAWFHWERHGIVTGGPYFSKDGCQPYQLYPCQEYGPITSCPATDQTPMCLKKCTKSTYATSYNEDLYYGESVYRVDNDVRAIQTEILTNGPVQAVLRVYGDLLTHKSGIYQHVFGEALEYHAVRIIGWGEENEVPYWTVANEWGQRWGIEGFFKILRGSNTAEIEAHIMAGIPRKLE